MMASTFSTTTPLGANLPFTSPAVTINNGGTKITGTVFADQAGTLLVEQSYDGTNWDNQTSFSVLANAGQGWTVYVVAPYTRLVYNNGSVAQTVFRLYGELRDDDGNFISPQTPTPGGQFAVLQGTSNGSYTYTYVGRFDGATAQDAAGFAAVAQNLSGKYAAFDVSTGSVVNVNVTRSAETSPTPF